MKNENVLFVERSVLNNNFDLTQQFLEISEENLTQLRYGFVSRDLAETDSSKKQLIPYVLMIDSNDKVFVYQRNGSEKRLSQKFSAGIGGHVNDGDISDSLLNTLLKGACREIKEEIGLAVRSDELKMLGMINEEETNVGHSHTGIVFVLRVEKSSMSFDKEIDNPQWVPVCDIPFEHAELWTELAIKLFCKVGTK